MRLVDATRNPASHNLPELEAFIGHGASPRASINLLKASRAHAFIHGRDFVTPSDVKAIAQDILRHRVSITYKAEAENITVSHIITSLL